jgi:hypothetical protein
MNHCKIAVQLSSRELPHASVFSEVDSVVKEMVWPFLSMGPASVLASAMPNDVASQLASSKLNFIPAFATTLENIWVGSTTCEELTRPQVEKTAPRA